MSEQNVLIDYADFDAYRALLAGHKAGDVDDNRLIGERLKLGVYAQRQDGLCMVRSKLPGGRLKPAQLVGYAEALEQYSAHDRVHITTRQDIQFHHVPLEKTPDLLEHLAGFGVGSREAGGNTVRNITACPLAGGCPHEQVDINPLVDATARHFVRHPLTQSLPRKFKMSFSGCSADCSVGLVHDLAVIAVQRDGQAGFQVRVGGGLGAKPRESILLEDFIVEQDLLPVIEAVLAVHDKNSDRKRKSRNRIKWLIERFGADGFIEKYRAELVRTRGAFDSERAPRGHWRSAEPAPRPLRLGAVLAQHQPGLVSVPVAVPHGDLYAGQLRGLARLLQELGLDHLRTTQEQGLVIGNVPEARSAALLRGLEQLALGLSKPGDRVISCPGTSTCTLGITASHALAPRLSGGDSDLTVRINGCQNSCANAELADIGLYGKGRRHHGKLIPSYGLQLGGGTGAGELAFDGPQIPAARVPSAVRRIEQAYAESRDPEEGFAAWSRRKGAGYFDQLLADLVRVSPAELTFLQRDQGDSRVFSVQSVGVGECAGAKADPFDKLLLDAAYEKGLLDAFVAKSKWDEAAESLSNRLLLVACAQLQAAGVPQEDMDKDRLPEALHKIGVPAEQVTALCDLLIRVDAEGLDEVNHRELLDGVATTYAEAHAWALAVRSGKAAQAKVG